MYKLDHVHGTEWSLLYSYTMHEYTIHRYNFQYAYVQDVPVV